MQKRRCGRTGLDLGVVGFGAMRLHGKDTKYWADIVAEAAEAGFNYFETSHRYCNSTSEEKIGAGLKGFRDRVYISTKSAPRDEPGADDVRRAIDESLKRLQVDYVDFYHLWDTKLHEFENIAARKGGTLEGIRKAMDDGLIRHLGITTHDTPENMIKLLATGEFEVVTLQYNLINRTTESVIEEAGRRGIGVIAMGPLHGGILAAQSPLFESLVRLGAGISAAEVAMRFVLTNPHVTCAISGITSSDDVKADKAIAENIKPLAGAHLAALVKVFEDFQASNGKVCTLCEYCMPCPQDIWIPGVLTLANAARLLGLVDEARRQYAAFAKGWTDSGGQAPCIECGHCVERCPQGIDVPQALKRAHELLK